MPRQADKASIPPISPAGDKAGPRGEKKKPGPQKTMRAPAHTKKQQMTMSACHGNRQLCLASMQHERDHTDMNHSRLRVSDRRAGYRLDCFRLSALRARADPVVDSCSSQFIGHPRELRRTAARFFHHRLRPAPLPCRSELLSKSNLRRRTVLSRRISSRGIPERPRTPTHPKIPPIRTLNSKPMMMNGGHDAAVVVPPALSAIRKSPIVPRAR